MLSYWTKFNDLWPLLRQFGPEKEPDDIIDFGVEQSADTMTYCIRNMKYIENVDEDHSSVDPWHFRQIGVHYQYHESSGQHVFVIIHPTEVLRQQLISLTSRMHHSSCDWRSIHTVILNFACQQWRPYLNDLQYQLARIVSPNRTGPCPD